MTKISNFKTPLRYPGGKAKFAHHIRAIIQSNNLSGGVYVEPFAGGAGVALDLLLSGHVNNIIINDIDPAIYSFWFSVVNHNDELCQMIESSFITIDNWHQQREILLNHTKHSLLDLAFATFFLNRTNRSGILKAGVIGGKEQKGKWKLDARFNKIDLINRIKNISHFKEKITVSNLDAVAFLNKFSPDLPENSLIYLDPPYYVKGAELYRNFYKHEDHVNIANTLRDIDLPWVVSYDNVEEIRKIYSQYRMCDYFLSYTAQDKKIGSEIIIYNDNLITPSILKK
ncbi:DNA adenine methylase [Escherichia coli]|uniref:DNA adenine methylase n=1 Tax=Escherichia coli TaxID=562 RepID=UPI000CFB6EFB|nr:DNA adenine methylase [Escherichia coli]EFH3341395.1 DNA adenine methylase [Escherichia coli]EHC1568860.1 DNA adenine methylase [Escherichia coli]EJD5584618.1 DNA adenine methylase [Escherichia coli]ELG4682209.1 DNA adenine methylase [Escherichia coli]ELO5045398.1 DNA adenine methylase [Escherichia coli]